MSPSPKLSLLPADASSHLQLARQALVYELPSTHDFHRRIQPDSPGELLPEQPAGRPRAPIKLPPARKRGKEGGDPTMLLERRLLTTMWNEKYHFEEWERVRNKMSAHRNRLGMRERPYRESDSLARNWQGSWGKSYNGERKRAVMRPGDKRAISDEDVLIVERGASVSMPDTKKRRLSESEQEERKGTLPPPPSKPQRKIPEKSDRLMESSEISGQDSTAKGIDGYVMSRTANDWNQSRSFSTTSNCAVGTPQRSDLVSDAAPTPSFPMATEILEAIPASGISLRKITERFWDRVSCDMEGFYILLHDNTDIDLGNALVRKREGAFEERPMTVPVVDHNGADRALMKVTAHDDSEIGGGYTRPGTGVVAGTRPLHIHGHSIGRRGGLDRVRCRLSTTSTRRKCMRRADHVPL